MGRQTPDVQSGEARSEKREAFAEGEMSTQMKYTIGANKSERRKAKISSLITHSEPGEQGFQLSFIQLDDPLLQQIKEDILNTEINTLTPVEALMKLNEIKKLLKKS